MPRRLHSRRLAALAAVLVALASSPAAPARLAAQTLPARSALPPGTVLEGYLAQAVLDPAVAGTRARVAGAGARLLLPLNALAGARHSDLARRVAVGGFVTSVPANEGPITARHYGVQADLRLADPGPKGRLEPLASLGVGAFRGRRAGDTPREFGPLCLQPTDVPGGAAPVTCVQPVPDRRETGARYAALSPAVGVRLGVMPGLALRTDVRDVMVLRDGLRHNLELGTGLSFVW